MNQVQYFNFNQNAIQVINKNGEAWFIASEVAAMLGYRDSYNMTRILDNDEKGTHNVSTLGGNQDVSVINESGFYHAAFKSRKPEVKPFRKWVTSEVLPTIRKTGGYQIGQKTTADDRTGLRQAVAALVGRKGIDYSSAYSMIHQRFNVEAIEDIPADKLPEAVAYVHALTLHTGLTGEVLDREPLPAPFDDLDVAHLLLHAQDIRLFIRRYLPAFENLSIDKGGALWSYVHDTAPVFNRVRAAVLPRLKDQWLQRQIMKTAGV
ncbi:BRO family protein [Neisseria sp. RH3002v2f]|uniref:BRO-N domain-containing protein n=1 Tax=Neisseria sp. RH3002v2f TaxID=1871108 RepID=UPI001CB6F861|nr:BRO family protein [Neisseria sp. RH3002v2f]